MSIKVKQPSSATPSDWGCNCGGCPCMPPGNFFCNVISDDEFFNFGTFLTFNGGTGVPEEPYNWSFDEGDSSTDEQISISIRCYGDGVIDGDVLYRFGGDIDTGTTWHWTITQTQIDLCEVGIVYHFTVPAGDGAAPGMQMAFTLFS